MNNDLADRIAAFLDTYHVMLLATHGPDAPAATSSITRLRKSPE